MAIRVITAKQLDRLLDDLPDEDDDEDEQDDVMDDEDQVAVYQALFTKIEALDDEAFELFVSGSKTLN